MFCDTNFLNFNQVWNTTDPDFSSCFHKTVLLWIPLAYLILLAPIRILVLHKSSNNFIIPWSWKIRIRLAFVGVLALLGAIDIGRSLHEHFNDVQVPTVNFLSPLSVVLAMVTFCIVVFFERKHGIQSSGFLFIFWFLLLVVSIFHLRSKIRVAMIEDMVGDMFRFVTFCLFFAVVLIQFVLACIVVDSTPVGAIPLDDKNPCPEHHVSFLSQITFWWFSGIVVQGYKKALVVADLWSLNPDDKCKNVFPEFEKYWNAELSRCKTMHKTGNQVPRDIEMRAMGTNRQATKEGLPEVIISEADCKKSTPRLFFAIIKTFGLKCFQAAVFKFIFDIFQFVSPVILKFLIEYTKNKEIQSWKGYFYACIILVVALIQSVVLHQYFYHCTVVGMRMRTAMIAAVYQKMLKLSNAAKKTSTVGEIVNLMSVDAQRLMDLMTYVNMIWSGPLQITISIYLLWVTLGPSILAGVAFMIIMIPLNGVIANKFKVYQVKQMSLKDTRIKMMNEILNGIKVLKLYAWEPSFEAKVLDIRNKELDILKKMSYLNAVTTFTWTVVPFLVSLITFAVYVLVDETNVLDADKAFVSLSLFNILRFPLSMVPQVISSLVQVNVSVNRLRGFLGADELDLEAVTYDDDAKSAVKIESGTFVWDKELMEKDKTGPTLAGINLDISDGQLIAVVGTVGSGKSSLLSAILGEMDKLHGKVTIKGSTAYVAQQAWIQNATLQDNVLFGRPFELGNYRQVIDSCALQSDLEIMPSGDQTEIGEKGINLSGGQKQRVSLARAVYQDADMYLLDDPLSAVDSHVGKHIFDNVIGPNGLLKGKTRLLVTHGVGFLSQVDTIVVLVDGKISEIGSYRQLLDHDGAFAEFLKNYLTEEMGKGDDDIEIDEEIMSQIGSIMDGKDAKLQKQISMLSERVRTMSDTNTATPPGTPGAARRDPSGLIHRARSRESLKASRTSLHKAEIPNGVEKEVKQEKEEEKKLIEAEKMETSRVKFSVFLVYLRSVGVLLGVSTIVFYILTNAANIYSNIWLSEWSNDANHLNSTNNGTIDKGQRNMRLGIYGLLGLIQGLTIITAALALNIGNLRAGKKLHAKMLRSMVACPMSFFDTTPTGRVLNRFGKDIDTLDTVLPGIMQSWIQVVLKVLSVPAIVGWNTPLFLAAAAPLSVLYIAAQVLSCYVELYVCVLVVLGQPNAYITSFLMLAAAICLHVGGVKAARLIHFKFINNVFKLPMAFFDTTPVGRILNRFSKDIDVLDKDICVHYDWCLRTSAIALSILFVIAYSTPSFLVAMVPIAILYIFIQYLVHNCACPSLVSMVKPCLKIKHKLGITVVGGALALYIGNVRAGRQIHHGILDNVLKSPMSFFDSTPIGRILNRFGKDIDILDTILAQNFSMWISCLLRVISVPVIVGYSTPPFLLTIIPLGIVYIIVQRFYVATSRQLKRLESVSRSPIYSHFGETVMGVTTVRAYRQQGRFIETSEYKVDENLICHYPSIVSNRWLAIRLEFVGNCILFFAALFAVIARNDLSPGIVGLSITYALNITQTLNWMVRMTTELETNIVAVERVKEYSDTPTEAAWEVKEKKPKADWPEMGVVEFEHYGTRYRPGLDLVVKDLNCKIQSGEKVGIVGRTGAGKSSLTLALFRIIESAEGKIKIDGVDIEVIGLHDLRSKLTIIPQEPVLFSGSLRMNLDPFDEHSDDLVWKALEHAHLKSFVSELPAKLEHECTEGGENLSVGQRQLVCLARALLRKTKILVLDEATAAVDLETDDLIQHTIRVEFKDATVLTIAHRLNTIMDYNRVMVLDQGNLREFDSPQALLQSEDTIFYGMAKDAGLV